MNDEIKQLYEQRVAMWRTMATRFALLAIAEGLCLILIAVNLIGATR